jgi:hypothetical protein
MCIVYMHLCVGRYLDGFKRGWFAIKDINRFDAIFKHPNGTIKDTNQMTTNKTDQPLNLLQKMQPSHESLPGGVACRIGQDIAIRTNGNKKLIDGHGSINGHFSTKILIDGMLFDGFWRMIGNHFG